MTEQKKQAPELTGKQVRYLRGLGHKLKPVVMVGRQHVSEEVIASADEALTTHELIKVKLQEGCIEDRRDVAAQLAKETHSAVAQVIGKTFLLYRTREDNPEIKLP